jgi:hypothetical protein
MLLRIRNAEILEHVPASNFASLLAQCEYEKKRLATSFSLGVSLEHDSFTHSAPKPEFLARAASQNPQNRMPYSSRLRLHIWGMFGQDGIFGTRHGLALFFLGNKQILLPTEIQSDLMFQHGQSSDARLPSEEVRGLSEHRK